MFKAFKYVCPQLMAEVIPFKYCVPYSLRLVSQLDDRSVRTE